MKAGPLHIFMCKKPLRTCLSVLCLPIWCLRLCSIHNPNPSLLLGRKAGAWHACMHVCVSFLSLISFVFGPFSFSPLPASPMLLISNKIGNGKMREAKLFWTQLGVEYNKRQNPLIVLTCRLRTSFDPDKEGQTDTAKTIGFL